MSLYNSWQIPRTSPGKSPLCFAPDHDMRVASRPLGEETMHPCGRVLALFALCSLSFVPIGAISKPMTSEDSKSLAVSIRVLTDRPRVGDPVPIEFTIRNIEKRDYSYLDRSYDRAGRMPEYELIAQSASGAK